MSLVRLGSICFERYVDGAMPRWASPWLIVREAIGVGVGMGLVALLMGLHMEDDAMVASVVSVLQRLTVFQGSDYHPLPARDRG